MRFATEPRIAFGTGDWYEERRGGAPKDDRWSQSSRLEIVIGMKDSSETGLEVVGILRRELRSVSG